jgi:hypothetical protein
MADRADWEKATAQQRHLAVAADAELRRRHRDQRFAPLRPAEPEPTTDTQRDELTLTARQQMPEMAQWIKDLATAHRTFADKLAERQSLMIPSQHPDYGDLGQRSHPGRDQARTRSCSRPSRRSGRPRSSSSVPRTATLTSRPRIDRPPRGAGSESPQA